jgi:hypothetical protein
MPGPHLRCGSALQSRFKVLEKVGVMIHSLGQDFLESRRFSFLAS